MFAYGIFKVIYAPQKALKEIMRNPKYIGPILIMILFAIANIAFVYVFISKTYVEQTFPKSDQKDMWTESSNFWSPSPGLNISENYVDYIKGTSYGNRSISFSINDSKQISMQLDNIGPINCSGSNGFNDLYLRIKLINPNENFENATIYLNSTTPSNYFYYNLTEKISNIGTNVWDNLTIPLKSKAWLNNSAAASWSNISGLRLEFVWSENSNITLLVDGLFFGGVFTHIVENVTSYMVSYATFPFMLFVIKWVLLAGVIYIMTRAFGAKTVWKPLLTLVGFVLVTIFVQALINAASYSVVPKIYYPFAFIGGAEGERDVAYNKILEETWFVSEINSYVQVGVYIWTMVLCALATRLLTEFSWIKCSLISAVAYFATLMVEGLMLGY